MQLPFLSLSIGETVTRRWLKAVGERPDLPAWKRVPVAPALPLRDTLLCHDLPPDWHRRLDGDRLDTAQSAKLVEALGYDRPSEWDEAGEEEGEEQSEEQAEEEEEEDNDEGGSDSGEHSARHERRGRGRGRGRYLIYCNAISDVRT